MLGRSFRRDGAGRHRVHAYVASAQVGRRCAGDAQNAGLDAAVDHRAHGRLEGRDGGDVDDGAAALRVHRLRRGLDAPDHRLEADLDHAVHDLRRDLGERLVADPGGVVDHDVQPSRLACEQRHCFAHPFARRHVARQPDGLASKARISATASSTNSGFRSLTPTVAPRRAIARAVARPMPWPAPLMKAARPARDMFMGWLSCFVPRAPAARPAHGRRAPVPAPSRG